uniref:Uncharacterized protein n=1 Tax=Romanomermis culicivorax TaxID=13658 RepID=A0A915HKE0_ROMCU
MNGVNRNALILKCCCPRKERSIDMPIYLLNNDIDAQTYFKFQTMKRKLDKNMSRDHLEQEVDVN